MFTLSSGFKYCYLILLIIIPNKKKLNTSIWSIDGTLTGITSPGQSGPENNGNEEILETPRDWFGFMTHQPLQAINAKSILYI